MRSNAASALRYLWHLDVSCPRWCIGLPPPESLGWTGTAFQFDWEYVPLVAPSEALFLWRNPTSRTYAQAGREPRRCVPHFPWTSVRCPQRLVARPAPQAEGRGSAVPREGETPDLFIGRTSGELPLSLHLYLIPYGRVVSWNPSICKRKEHSTDIFVQHIYSSISGTWFCTIHTLSNSVWLQM